MMDPTSFQWLAKGAHLMELWSVLWKWRNMGAAAGKTPSLKRKNLIQSQSPLNIPPFPYPCLEWGHDAWSYSSQPMFLRWESWGKGQENLRYTGPEVIKCRTSTRSYLLPNKAISLYRLYLGFFSLASEYIFCSQAGSKENSLKRK